MSLKSQNKIDTNRVELEVVVDAETFEKGLAAAFKKQSKKISIPGFRKGKAPRAFVEKYFGKEVFYEDAVNALYPDALGRGGQGSRAGGHSGQDRFRRERGRASGLYLYRRFDHKAGSDH